MVLTFFGPVFWLAFILLRAFPCFSTQWQWAESSGLQQRGLRRNDCNRSFTGFPFNVVQIHEQRTRILIVTRNIEAASQPDGLFMVIAFTPGLQPQQIGTVADVVVSGLALAIQAALGILGVLTQQGQRELGVVSENGI